MLTKRATQQSTQSAEQMKRNYRLMAASIGALANPQILSIFYRIARWGLGKGAFMSLSKKPSAGVIQLYHKIVFQISYNWIQTVPSVSDWLYPP